MCLNLPAVAKEEKRAIYEETNGGVPVAQGFGTTVLRRLSTHSLGNRHWQCPKSDHITGCMLAKLGVSTMRAAHVLVSSGQRKGETRSGTVCHGLMATVELGGGDLTCIGPVRKHGRMLRHSCARHCLFTPTQRYNVVLCAIVPWVP